MPQIGIARGDHAVERRQHILVAGQRLQPIDIGLVRLDGRLFAGEVGDVVSSRSCCEIMRELARLWRRFRVASDNLALDWAFEQVGARLHELLVEVRRVDLGEELSGLDRRADVDLPVLQIATDARIDGRA